MNTGLCPYKKQTFTFPNSLFPEWSQVRILFPLLTPADKIYLKVTCTDRLLSWVDLLCLSISEGNLGKF